MTASDSTGVIATVPAGDAAGAVHRKLNSIAAHTLDRAGSR
jgi:hypothetical protein